jgi:shikimate kinase
MSGTGKSTLVAALTALGHRAIDTDDGYCVEASNGEWVWDEQRMDALFATSDVANLVVAGCASNQGQYYDHFDIVILLSAPIDVLITRLERRTNNPFGKSEDEQRQVRRDLALIEPRLRAIAHAEVATNRPLAEVLDDVLRLVDFS